MSTSWLITCRLTCVGGSEHGECDCPCPNDCQMQDHPDFAQRRAEATQRLANTADDPRLARFVCRVADVPHRGPGERS